MANLIYTDDKYSDVGYLSGFSLDCENGDENSFDLEMSLSKAAMLSSGCLIYSEADSEFGGIVTKRFVNTDSKKIVFKGHTWRGILSTKIVVPPVGEAFRKYENKSTSYIMNDILQLTGLNELFIAADTSNSMTYTFHRFTDVLSGFVHMLRTLMLKMRCVYDNISQKVVISAQETKDHSSDDFSSHHFGFSVQKDDFPVNHLMGLGRGELLEREIYSLYLQEDGSIAETQHYTGFEENAATYEYVNYETTDEFHTAVRKRLIELQNSTSLEISLRDMSVDIGDTVSGTEEITGITVTKSIRSKILKMTDTEYAIDYRTGD